MGLFTRLEKETIAALTYELEATAAASTDQLLAVIDTHTAEKQSLEAKLREQKVHYDNLLDAHQRASVREAALIERGHTLSAELAELKTLVQKLEGQLNVSALAKAFAEGKASVNDHNTEKLNTLFKHHELHGQGRIVAHGRTYRLYKCSTCPPEAPLQIQIPEDMEWYI